MVGCLIADKIDDRYHDSVHPEKCKCTNSHCTNAFQECTEDVRVGLDNLDSECGYVHHDSTLQSDLHFSVRCGHPISFEFSTCSSCTYY